MDFHAIEPGDRVLIQAYGDGGFRIAGRRIQGAVVVFQDRVIEAGNLRFEDIERGHLQPLLDAVPRAEILLLGGGKSAGALPSEHHALLMAAGISAEVMDTGAACRTFNLLQGERRRVAALLIAVP